MSARLAFNMTPEPERRKLVEFIQKNYVLVDVDGYAPGASSADVTWWTSVSGKAENDGCGNNAWYVATAAGTRLGDPVARGLPDLRKAWINFKAQPEDERRPKIGTPALDRPKTARLTPPPGALILRTYFNPLEPADKQEIKESIKSPFIMEESEEAINDPDHRDGL